PPADQNSPPACGQALLARVGDPGAQLLLVLADLAGRIALGEFGRLEDLAHLDFSSAVEGRALEPLDGLGLRLALPEPEPGDQLFRLGERPIDDRALLAFETNSRAVLARVQPLARQHHAGLDQLLV